MALYFLIIHNISAISFIIICLSSSSSTSRAFVYRYNVICVASNNICSSIFIIVIITDTRYSATPTKPMCEITTAASQYNYYEHQTRAHGGCAQLRIDQIDSSKYIYCYINFNTIHIYYEYIYIRSMVICCCAAA
jgi:hypothetical protein